MSIAFSFCLVACGNNTGGTGINPDTSSTNVPMMDSASNTTPAEGKGDTSLNKNSNRAGTGPANDSVH